MNKAAQLDIVSSREVSRLIAHTSKLAKRRKVLKWLAGIKHSSFLVSLTPDALLEQTMKPRPPKPVRVRSFHPVTATESLADARALLVRKNAGFSDFGSAMSLTVRMQKKNHL